MSKIVSIRGVRGQFVVGLSWRHEDQKPNKPYIKMRAKTERKPWYVVRDTPTGAFQLGMCERLGDTIKARQVQSLAANVANLWPAPWMGIFKIDANKYWYIAVRDGQEVIPDGDFVGTLEEVTTLKDRHMIYGGWNLVETEIHKLSGELSRLKASTYALSELDEAGNSRIYLQLAFITLMVLGAAGAWKYHSDKIREEELQRAQAAALAAAKVKAAPQRSPWQEMMGAQAFLDACQQAWSIQKLGKKQWTLTQWNCAVGIDGAVTIDTAWKTVDGFANDAPGKLSLDGTQSNLHVEHGKPKFESLSDVIDMDSSVRSILTTAKTNHFEVSLQAGSKSTTSASIANNDHDWMSHEFILNFDAAPFATGLVPTISSVPGLRLKTLSWNGVSWSATGVLFGFVKSQM